MRHVIPLLALMGCSSQPADDWSSSVDELRDRVGEYTQAVRGAADPDAVTTLQGGYSDDMEVHMGDMAHMDEAWEGCGMGMQDHEPMAMGDLDAMSEALRDHLADHEGHDDVAQCEQAAEEHEAFMDEHLDSLLEHHEAGCGSMMGG